MNLEPDGGQSDIMQSMNVESDGGLITNYVFNDVEDSRDKSIQASCARCEVNHTFIIEIRRSAENEYHASILCKREINRI